MHSILNEIAITIISATIAGLICHILKQPIILGYVLAGVAIGANFGFGLVEDPHTVEIISEIGLILLLYVIGLEINLRTLLASGRQLLVTAFSQLPLCVLLGLAFFSTITISYVNSSLEILYASLLCALSSTAIGVKGLLDKIELDTMPGKMTLGTLVIQDMYAIIILAIQPNFSAMEIAPIFKAILNTVLILGLGFLLSKYILKNVFHLVSKSPEMIVCLSIGWCAAMAGIADIMGVSREMGALVAGLSIAAFPYSVNITAKTLPLRDFFLTLFFVSLGMKLVLPAGPIIIPVLMLSVFLIASRFLTINPILLLTGAGRRIAFVTSLNLSQLSEFSLVIGSIGLTYNHVSKDFVSLLVFTMVFLSLISSYAIRYSHQIFLNYDSLLTYFGYKDQNKNESNLNSHTAEIVFLGYHRAAEAMLEHIVKNSPELVSKILVVDFNPMTLTSLKESGIKTLFGDIASFEILSHCHLEHSKIIISSIPDMLLKGTNNLLLSKMINDLAPESVVVLTADNIIHEQELVSNGANLTVSPFDLSGKWLAEVLFELYHPRNDFIPEKKLARS